MDFKIKTVPFDNKTYKLQIWDTAGQERFRTITASYYKGVHAYLLVCDGSDPAQASEQIEGLELWYKDICLLGGNVSSKDVPPILVVVNKMDKYDNDSTKEFDISKTVVPQEIIQWCHQKSLPFIATSAKANYNVDQAFMKLLEIEKRHVVCYGIPLELEPLPREPEHNVCYGPPSHYQPQLSQNKCSM